MVDLRQQFADSLTICITSHVLLLASFADQSYNYLSIVRGKYRINHPATGQNNDEKQQQL